MKVWALALVGFLTLGGCGLSDTAEPSETPVDGNILGLGVVGNYQSGERHAPGMTREEADAMFVQAIRFGGTGARMFASHLTDEEIVATAMVVCDSFDQVGVEATVIDMRDRITEIVWNPDELSREEMRDLRYMIEDYFDSVMGTAIPAYCPAYEDEATRFWD